MAEIAKDKAERRSGAQGAQPAPATREKDEKEKRRESDSVFGVKPVSTQAKIRDLLVKIKKENLVGFVVLNQQKNARVMKWKRLLNHPTNQAFSL